jgi:tetratricopeptide (TPR) repeat protein
MRAATDAEKQFAAYIRNLSERRPRLAIEKAREYLRANPDSFVAWCALGRVYMREKQNDEAEKCFGEVDKIDPQNVFVLSARAELKFCVFAEKKPRPRNQVKAAESFILQAIKQAPEVAQFHILATRVYIELEDYKTALDFAKKASQLPMRDKHLPDERNLDGLKLLFQLGKDQGVYGAVCKLMSLPVPKPSKESTSPKDILEAFDEDMFSRGNWARGTSFSDVAIRSDHPVNTQAANVGKRDRVRKAGKDEHYR